MSDYISKHTCIICSQMLDYEAFPAKPDGSQCNHSIETCSQCWRQWLQIQVASKTFDKIRCAQCTEILGQSEIRHLAAEDTYQRYLDSELRSILSSDPNFYWCISGSCNSGQLHFDGDIFTCQACGNKACMSCKGPWHAGETCGEHQEHIRGEQEDSIGSSKNGLEGGMDNLRLKDEKAELRRRQENEENEAAVTLSRVSKLCPGCTRKVQKRGGCDYIHCTQCNSDFCWLCLADYQKIWREGNSAHEKDCTYWAAGPWTEV